MKDGLRIPKLLVVRLAALVALSVCVFVFIAVSLGGVIYRRGASGPGRAASASDSAGGGEAGFFALYAPGDPVDLDGDGADDAVAVDSDGDGIPDGVDFDGDGASDPFDLDMDGVADEPDFDLDGDGVFDTYSFMVAWRGTPSTASDGDDGSWAGPGTGGGWVDSGPGAGGGSGSDGSVSGGSGSDGEGGEGGSGSGAGGEIGPGAGDGGAGGLGSGDGDDAAGYEDDEREVLGAVGGAGDGETGPGSDAAGEGSLGPDADATEGGDGAASSEGTFEDIPLFPMGSPEAEGGPTAATPPVALRGGIGPMSLGDAYEVWVYTWSHDPLWDDDGDTVADVPWDWDDGAAPADPDDPDTCPGLYEVLTHADYDGYTVYLCADVTIPGDYDPATMAGGGADIDPGIQNLTIDGMWPAVPRGDIDDDGIPDDEDEDIDGDGIPNAQFTYILSEDYYPMTAMDTHIDGSHALYQSTVPNSYAGNYYDAGVNDTLGRYWSLRMDHPFESFTFQNMDLYGSTAESPLWVSPDMGGYNANDHGNLVAYKQVYFSGPQMAYNVNGRVLFENCSADLEIAQGTGVAAGTQGFMGVQELAQAAQVEFAGHFNLDYDNGHALMVFPVLDFTPTKEWFAGDAPSGNGGLYSITVRDGATVRINARNAMLTRLDTSHTSHDNDDSEYEWSNLDIYVGEGAEFSARVANGFTANLEYDSDIGEMVVEEGGRFYVGLQIASTDIDVANPFELRRSFQGFPLVGTATVKSGGSFLFYTNINLERGNFYTYTYRNAFIGDMSWGTALGNWVLEGGEFRLFGLTSSASSAPNQPEHLIIQKGIEVSGGGMFLLGYQHEYGDDAMAYGGDQYAVAIGTGGIDVQGAGSTFYANLDLRSGSGATGGVECAGDITVGQGSSFAILDGSAFFTGTQHVPAMLHMTGTSPSIRVTDPRTFALTSAACTRLIETDYTGKLYLGGEQVNYWTTWAPIYSSMRFPPARPDVQWRNDPSDLVDPGDPDLGTTCVELECTLYPGSGPTSGVLIAPGMYTGALIPGDVEYPFNHSRFLTDFGSIKAISAGRIRFTVNPRNEAWPQYVSGTTSAPYSMVHAFASPQASVIDWNMPDGQYGSDGDGKFGLLSATAIDEGDLFTVIVMKHFVFAEGEFLAQPAAKPMVVYVDGTLPATLPGGGDPDGAGRGGTPSDPVRTLRRAMELLERSGGHVVYILGTVTVAQDTAILDAGGGRISFLEGSNAADTIYLQGPFDQLTQTYGGIGALEIRRFARPTAGEITVGGSPNPDYVAAYDVDDFTGQMFVVNASVKMDLGPVVMDGSHGGNPGEYFCHTVYEVDTAGNLVLDGGGDPIVYDSYPIPMSRTQVKGNPTAGSNMIRVNGRLELHAPFTARNNYNTYTGSDTPRYSGFAYVSSGAALTTDAPSGGWNEFYGFSYITPSSSAGHGGALYGANGSTLTIDGAKFHHNTDTRCGGAVYSMGSTTITNSQFYDNSAGDRGGAVGQVAYGFLHIKATVFHDNASGTYGGAVYNSSTVCTMDDLAGSKVEIYANTAASGGGAVYNLGSMTVYSAYIHDNTVNTATAMGGGIYTTGNLDIRGGEFSYNTTTSAGGFLAVRGTAGVTTLSISGGEFHHNSSSSGAGGMADLGNVTASVTGGDFHHNSAGASGGVFSVGTGAALTIDGGSYHENRTTGGCVAYNYTGAVTYKSGAIYDNVTTAAMKNGKAFYVFGPFTLDCPAPGAAWAISPGQDIYLASRYDSGTGVTTSFYIDSVQRITSGMLDLTVAGGYAGRPVVDYDDAIPNILVTGTSDQLPYYSLSFIGSDYFQLAQRAADISVLELKQVFPAFPVVYVDGTLPATLGDGTSPDAPGRGGTPSDPVRTLKRAFELLREAEPYLVPIPDAGVTHVDNVIEVDGSGAPLENYLPYANRIYIVGKVTVNQDMEIDTMGGADDMDHIYYHDSAMAAASEAPIELAAPHINIYRYVKPLCGATDSAFYDSRWNVASYTGDLFQVGDDAGTGDPRGEVTLRLGRKVDVDGSYAVPDDFFASATYKNNMYWKVGWKRTGVTGVTKAGGTMFDVRYDGRLILGLDAALYPAAYAIPDVFGAHLHNNYLDLAAGISGHGGAIRVRGILDFNSGYIEYNYCGGSREDRSAGTGYGGGIAVMQTGVASLNGLIRHNGAHLGGGVSIYLGGSVTVVDAGLSIFGNIAYNMGGGVFLNGMPGQVPIFDFVVGAVEENVCLENGGGIYATSNTFLDVGGTGTVVSIRGNVAGNGGGVMNMGTALLRDAAIRDNVADWRNLTSTRLGGGIYNGGTMEIYGGLIDNCYTRRQVDYDTTLDVPIYDHVGNGGGIYNASGTCDIYGATAITNCKATGGGGIFIYHGDVNFVDGSNPTISGCQATLTASGAPVVYNALGNGVGGGVYVYTDARFYMGGGSILMNTAASVGGGISHQWALDGAMVTLAHGSVSYNHASMGGGMYLYYSYASDHTYTLAQANVGMVTFAGNTASAGVSNAVYQGGKLVLTQATHGFAPGQDIYLAAVTSIPAYGGPIVIPDRVINRLAYDTTGGLPVEVENPSRGRDVVVYDPACVIAPGVDPQHMRYTLGSTVPTYYFLVQEAANANVLELQNWQVFDVAVSDEFFLIMKNGAGGNEALAVPVGGVTSTDTAAVADADTNLVSPAFRIENNGAFNVQVQVIGFVNKNGEAGVNTGLYPNISLVPSSTAALLPTAADNELYLEVKPTATPGNSFAFTAASLHTMGTVGANTIILGNIPAPTGPAPDPFGEFEFYGAAGDGFMEKYKDGSFPLSAAAAAKKDHIRTVVPGAPNTANQGRAKWQMYFKIIREPGT
jgi:hypothetical protein